jgi:hypothetical protein
MNKQLLLIFVSLALSVQANSHQQKFIEKYAINEDIKTILDDHSDELIAAMEKHAGSGKVKHGVWKFPWLPGYYVKYNLDRIYGLERMNRCIEEFGLDSLVVAQKRIYHVKGRPTELSNDNYLVIAKAVKAEKGLPPLTLNQIEQMCKLMHETSYVSLHTNNYIRIADNKIALIDTESTYDSNDLLLGYARLIGAEGRYHAFTKEAFSYLLINALEEYKNHKSSAKKDYFERMIKYVNGMRKKSGFKALRFFDESFARQ